MVSVASAAVFAAGVAPAFAQTGNTTGAADLGVEQVVVTAQKREQNLQDVPIAITAISQERLSQLGASRLSDLSNRAPNFLIEKFANAETVFIRGVGGGGRSIGFGGRAGVYIDGVYTGQVGAIDQALADIERVEILRGPQGTLFGRNSVSGAVNIITRAPSPTFTAGIDLKAGNYDERSLAANISGPIVPDRVLAKLSVFREKRDGYITNLFDGSTRGGMIDGASVRGALRLLPTDRLTVDIAADYSRDKSQIAPIESISNPLGAGLADPAAPDLLQINENERRIRDNKDFGVNLTAGYRLPADLTLTSITAFRGVNSFRQTDTDYSPLALLGAHYGDRFNQVTEELRIASPSTGRLRYVVGLYFLDELALTGRDVTVGKDAVGRLPAAPGVTPSSARIRNRSYAAFGNFDFDLAGPLILNAGARFTHEHRTLLFNLDGSRSGGFGIGTVSNFRDAASEDHVSPTVGLTYKVSPEATLYAKYAGGFKSGGWNVDFLTRAQTINQPGQTGTPFAFQTETADSYEIGAKTELFERRLRINAAAFLASYSDYQINQFVGATGIIQLTNAAKVDTSGLELSLEGRITPNLRLTADAAFLRTRFASFPHGGVAGADATGNRLPFAARFSGAAGGEYVLPLDLAGGRLALFYQYTFRGFSYTSQENTLPGQAIPSHGLSTGRVSWLSANRRYELAVYGENLGDHRYIVNQGKDLLGTNLLVWGEPLTWGVELKAKM
ncbi:MAG: TonB-dependent receptor [Caulobacteraceae bacterium]